MIGSGLKKLAGKYSMRVSSGMAYGRLMGFATTMCEGSGWKRIDIATRFESLEQQKAFETAVYAVDMKREYRVQSMAVNQRNINVVFQDTVGTMKKIEAFIAWFYPLLEQNGAYKADICAECGIPEVDVISVCGHDTQSAITAVPAEESDFAFLSSGTWSLFGTELDKPIVDEKSIAMNVTNEGGYNEKVGFLKNIIGLWLAQESRRQWIREGKEYGFGELEVMAQQAEPFQSFIDPDSPEFNTTGDIPGRIRAFCERTGQKVPETIGDIMCCINQSLALKYRYALEQIETITGKHFNMINMIGGGIQSKLLCQMTASANNRKVLAGPVEATALGNIAVQLMALGEIKDIKEARQIIANSEKTYEYFPQDKEKWDAAYEKFKTILKK